ncbi:MAG: AI-2E family transporter, partial [Burkholderiales bacterium]
MESPDQAMEANEPRTVSSAADWNRRNVVAWTLVAILILVAAAVWGFLQIAEALAPFVLGGFIAFLVRPIVNAFQRRMSRGLAVTVTFVLLLVVGILAVALLVPLFVTNAEQFIQNVPAYVQQAQASANQIISATSALPTSVQKAMTAASAQTAATL